MESTSIFKKLFIANLIVVFMLNSLCLTDGFSTDKKTETYRLF